MATRSKKTTEKNLDLTTGEILLPRLRHSENFVLMFEDYEPPNTEPSQTIPDQVMTMTEIFNRFAGGRPINAHVRTPQYHGDIEMPDLSRMDLVDIDEMLHNVRSNRELLQQQLNDEVTLGNQLEAEKRAKEKEAEDQRLLELYSKRKQALEE